MCDLKNFIVVWNISGRPFAVCAEVVEWFLGKLGVPDLVSYIQLYSFIDYFTAFFCQ